MPAQTVSGVTMVATLREQPAAKPVSHCSEASALAVVETKALPGEPRLQQSILFAQKRDDIGLLTLEPAAQRGDHQLEREHGRSLNHCRRSICGTLRALAER